MRAAAADAFVLVTTLLDDSGCINPTESMDRSSLAMLDELALRAEVLRPLRQQVASSRWSLGAADLAVTPSES